MSFLNIPLKTVQADLIGLLGVASMPWYDPLQFPVAPGNPYPAPAPRDYRWRVTLSISVQQQSSYITRNPGEYNGQDIMVGQWLANINTGQAWQIISIESKTTGSVIAIVQDIYRYNTYRDSTKQGNGSPSFGTYIVFDISDTGLPQIDPIPDTGVSSVFTQNLTSRFEYINLQYDYPLYQEGNSFVINDVIAADAVTNSFVLSDADNKIVIGRVTSISDTIPGWFTINPVQKVVDFLDYLPGNVGDIIYSSTTQPGGITLLPGGAQLYIKLRNNTLSTSYSTLPGPTVAGNMFQINGQDATVAGAGTMDDVVSASNLIALQTGVAASKVLVESVAQTNPGQLFYGEVVLDITTPAVAIINGISVTFNIQSTTAGYTGYTQSAQMATSINNANIPNIVATAPTSASLIISDITGGSITITNISADAGGVFFAGNNSGTGIPLLTSASAVYKLKFVAIDARAINFFDVVGSTIEDFGIPSVENGVKACGLYIEEGLRNATSTVVANLTQLNALSPLIGDTAYVIDSDDGSGNNVGEWSMWLFNGSTWIQTSNQDSASTDAKSLEYTVTPASPQNINIGQISTGRRVSLITVEVTTPFDGTPSLDIGYRVNNPVPQPAEFDGLMSLTLIDLTVAGTYTTSTDILFGIDTVQGDVEITATFTVSGATIGEAQIIVSYA